MQLCFRIAEEFGRPLEEVEEFGVDELARYVAWFELKNSWHEESLRKARRGH